MFLHFICLYVNVKMSLCIFNYKINHSQIKFYCDINILVLYLTFQNVWFLLLFNYEISVKTSHYFCLFDDSIPYFIPVEERLCSSETCYMQILFSWCFKKSLNFCYSFISLYFAIINYFSNHYTKSEVTYSAQLS